MTRSHKRSRKLGSRTAAAAAKSGGPHRNQSTRQDTSIALNASSRRFLIQMLAGVVLLASTILITYLVTSWLLPPRVIEVSEGRPDEVRLQAETSLAALSVDQLAELLKLPQSLPAGEQALPDIEQWQRLLDDSLEALQASYPNDAQVEHLVGLTQLRLKRTERAEPSLRRCVELAPDDAPMRSDLAELLQQLGRDDEALAVLQSPSSSQPKSAQYLEQLGDCQMRLGRLEEAEASLSASIKLNNGVASAWSKLGKTQLQMRKLQLAEEAARQAVQLRPDFAEAWQLLSQILAQAKRADDAREALLHWQALQSTRPADSTPGLPAARMPPTRTFEERIGQESRQVLASAFRSMAALYQIKQQEALANTMRQRALRLNPVDVAALTSQAAWLRSSGDWPQAVELNRLLLQLQPYELAHYQNLANLFMQAGRARDAGATLRLASQRLSQSSQESQDTHEPQDTSSQGTSLQSGSAHLLLARFLILLGKPQEAIAPAQLALEQQQPEAQAVLQQAQQTANLSQ